MKKPFSLLPDRLIDFLSSIWLISVPMILVVLNISYSFAASYLYDDKPSWEKFPRAFARISPSIPWIISIIASAFAFGMYVKHIRHIFDTRIRSSNIETENALGILETYNKLEDSKANPQVCMSTVDSSLDFLGNGASKWSNHLGLFEEMLKRIGNRGEVRFLLVDPIKNKHPDEEISKRSARSILNLWDIKTANPTIKFDIRLYEHNPFFRVTFIDREELFIGHYRGNYHSDSKDSPVLNIVSKGVQWTLFHPFRAYFENEWTHSATKAVNIQIINELRSYVDGTP